MLKRKQMAIAAATLCIVTTLKAWALKRSQLRKRRQWWIRPGLRKRGTCGFYATLRSKLSQQDPRCLKNFLRMSVEDFDFLVARLTPHLRKRNTHFREAISVGEKLAVTLRYLATGDSFSSLMTVFLLGKTTICHAIHETCRAIVKALKDEFLRVPSSPEEWTEVANRFQERWNFPNCCGALDGKRIALQKYNSIVLMAMADADYKFLFVDVETYGRESDGDVFGRCTLSTALAENTLNFPPPKPLPYEGNKMPFVIVTDKAFPLKPYLLKPFCDREQDISHKIFNYRLSRPRNVIENMFGICASRFRILSRPMDVTPEHAKAIVLTICVLHNFLLSRKSVYLRSSDVDNEAEGVAVRGSWRRELGETGTLPSIQPSSTLVRPASGAVYVREQFMEYFMTPHGEVASQYNGTIFDSIQLDEYWNDFSSSENEIKH